MRGKLRASYFYKGKRQSNAAIIKIAGLSFHVQPGILELLVLEVPGTPTRKGIAANDVNSEMFGVIVCSLLRIQEIAHSKQAYAGSTLPTVSICDG